MTANLQKIDSPLAYPEAEMNTTFGLSESIRKFVAGGLLVASAFFAGCAKSLEERISDLGAHPSPPVSTVLEHPDWFKGDTITIKGTPFFEKDESYTTTSTTLMPISTGKSVILIPQTHTNHHAQFLYRFSEENTESNLHIRSACKLTQTPSVISGEVKYENGITSLSVRDALTKSEFETPAAK